MFFHFIRHIFIFTLILLFSTSSKAIEQDDKNNPQAYINHAISIHKTAPNAASNALKKAYNLAKSQNNTLLVARVLLEQAQLAKLQKDFFLAQQYLSKSEAILPLVSNDELSVLVLTNMSAVQRHLKNYESSMDYVHKALAIARKNGEAILIFKCLQIKGTLLQKMKRDNDAIATYISSQRYMTNVNSTQKIRLFRDIANVYNKLNEYKSAIIYYNKALKIIEEVNDIEAIPNTLVEIAKTEAKLGLYSDALENAKRSLDITLKYEQEKEQLNSLVLLSTIYRKIGNYEKALLHGIEAIDIYKENSNLNGLAASKNAVGLIYQHLDQVEAAKTYFTQVINIPEDKIEPKYRAAALRSLGKLIFAENLTQHGLDLSNEAFAIYEKLDNKNGVATVQKNLGYMYYKMGNISESTYAYNTSISLFQSMGDVWNEADSKANLSLVLIETDLKKAIELAKDSLDLATKIGAKSVTKQAYTSLILAEKKRNNHQQALLYTKKKELLINEIKTDAVNKRIANTHISLHAKKDERFNDMLKQKKPVSSLEIDNKKSQLSLLEQEKTISNFQTKTALIIVSVVVVILILLLLKIRRIP